VTSPFIEADEIAITPDDAVAAATGFIRELCGWDIYPQESVTETVKPQGGASLLLSTLKLVSVQSITVNGESLDPSKVTAWEYGELERVDCCCWPFYGSVSVEYMHGYNTVPPAIRAVAQSIAKRWPASASPWTNRKMGTASVGMSTGVGVVPLGALTVVEQMVIDRFTLPGRP